MRTTLCVTLLALAGATLLGACGECATTVWCSSEPTLSYSGQFIEHKSGRGVAGVRVTFTRETGISLVADTVVATSDGDGFFRIVANSVENGAVTGTLHVTPPQPYAPYTVANVRLATSRVRGEGGWLGRMMVNPYLFVVGNVYDRQTQAQIPNAAVTIRRISGGRASEDGITLATDFGGQFAWEPQIIDAADIVASFEIKVPGYPRPYIVQRTLQLQYRDDTFAFVRLPVGSGLAYSGTTGRRATGEQLAGTTVQFTRTGGIAVTPAAFTLTPDASGSFPIPLEPSGDGTVFGDLRIVPPAPYRTETHPLSLATSDDDVGQWLGFLGYGAQIYSTAELRDAQTGAYVPSGTPVIMQRRSGVALAWPTPRPNGDALLVGDNGRLVYQAPTADSGAVNLDVIVRPPSPYLPDTINLTLPARYSDAAHAAGVITVRRRSP